MPALSAELREEGFRLRHSLFIDDLHWFDPRPDGRETDEYDSRAIMVLIRNAPTNEAIGCLRIITTSEDPSTPLPFENICGQTLDRSILGLDSLPRAALGEVSRLGVISKFRRRRGEAASPVPSAEVEAADSHLALNRRQFPHLLTALYLATYAVAAHEHIDYLFTVTETRLMTHLMRLGVPIRQIGPIVDYIGPRIPSVVDVRSGILGLTPYVRELYAEIVQDVQDAYVAQHRATATTPA